MGIKIKEKILENFINKVRLSGKQQVTEGLFEFGENGLKTKLTSASQQSQISGILKREAFKEYEAIGNVGLNQLDVFVSVLKRFNNYLDIEKNGNLLKLSEKGKSVDVELMEESFFQEQAKVPNLEFTDTFEMTASKLKDIFNDITINKDIVLTIKTEDKKVLFTNDGKFKFRTEIVAPQCSGGVKVDFGQPFIDALSNLDGNLTVSLATDYPAKIVETCDESKITLITAPRVEDSE